MDKDEINLIKNLISQESNIEIQDINDNTKIGSLEIDSLSLLSICSEIEDKYKISLINTAKDLKDLNIKERTFSQFIEYIESKIQNEKK